MTWLNCSEVLLCGVSVLIIIFSLIGLYLNARFVLLYPKSPRRAYVMYKSVVKLFVASLYAALMLDQWGIDLPWISNGFLPHGAMRLVVLVLIVTMALDSWLRPYDQC